MEQKVDVSIIGGSGYTGLELIRLLSQHQFVNIKYITSRQFVNKKVTDIFPSLQLERDFYFIEPDIDKIVNSSDIIFTALPHQTAMPIVAEILKNGKKVIDLSADFRFSDISIYEKWYTEHNYKEINSQAVYGLPEIFREKIKGANLIANPGCYPTGAILGIYPILKSNIEFNPKIIIDSKSGVSGAGRNPSLKTLFTEVNDNFSAYNIGKHRHEPEIKEKCCQIYEKDLEIVFTPHLLPINRGILSTIYIEINDKVKFEDIYSIYTNTYKNEYFVKILPQNQFPTTAYVKGSNFCLIGIFYNESSRQLIVVTAIDNLIKGASGQAIQNMNVIYDFNENEGLTHFPIYL